PFEVFSELSVEMFERLIPVAGNEGGISEIVHESQDAQAVPDSTSQGEALAVGVQGTHNVEVALQKAAEAESSPQHVIQPVLPRELLARSDGSNPFAPASDAAECRSLSHQCRRQDFHEVAMFCGLQ